MKKFFRLTSPYRLSLLGDQFRKANFNGFYLRLNNLKLEQTELGDKRYKKSKSYIKSLRTLNKDLILYYDWTYHHNKFLVRPKYFDPITFKEYKSEGINDEDKERLEKILKKNRERIKKIETSIKLSKCNTILNKVLTNYDRVSKQINEQLSLETFLKNDRNQKKSPTLYYELPQIPEFPKETNKKQYYNKINNNIRKINENFIELSSQMENEKILFPIKLMKENVKEKDNIYNFYIKSARNFEKILLWIIDLKKLSPNDNFYNAFMELLKDLSKNHKRVFLKYVGIEFYHLINRSFPNFYAILRSDGYSGRNINIAVKAQAARSKDFLDIHDLKHKNERNLLEVDEKKEFNCNCPKCEEYGVKNYADVQRFYFSEDILDNPQYSPRFNPVQLVQDREEYRLRKCRTFQRNNRNIHCFYNCNRIINLSYNEFKSEFNEITNRWNK